MTKPYFGVIIIEKVKRRRNVMDILYIGCHLSSSGGFMQMGKTAKEIGANTFAFFTRNPRGCQAKELSNDDVNAYIEFARENNFGKIVAHAPYTLNCCAADDYKREFALNTMLDDMKRMEQVPGNYYNFHPGSHVGQGEEKGKELIAEILNKVITPTQTTTILLETMAGKGSEIGRSFSELKDIIDMTNHSEKLGVCLDTCHVYDAGYDIVNNLDGVLEEFDRIIGIDRLKAVHLNDSKNPFSSHKDRHEKIGLGSLGTDAISNVINNKYLKNLPFILETPNELSGYKEEIELLRSLYNPK